MIGDAEHGALAAEFRRGFLAGLDYAARHAEPQAQALTGDETLTQVSASRPYPLKPGYNVDRVDIEAGLEMAEFLGYDSPQEQMVVTYALQRQARAEEDGAEKTALGGKIDLTSWYAIKAVATMAADRAARAAATEKVQS